MTRSLLSCLFAAFISISTPPCPAEEAYPRADFLVEPATLAAEPQGLVILDAREQKKFYEARISRALWVDPSAWSKAFGGGSDEAGWSRRIGDLGIRKGSRVVVYDDSVKEAARIWWILRYWGVEDARLLNGGWVAWKKAGLPVETGAPRSPEAAGFAAKAMTKRLATKDRILASLKDGSLQLVDARSEGEYCGTDKLKNKRGGAIPGARNLDWTDLIEKDTLRFKGAAELRKLLRDAGITLDRPTATYCQSGGRAAAMDFALELLGARDASNYFPSWQEWGNADDTPVAPGKPREE
jgi:thiosulfate/3-mercaptopyruvate sulfurtransferase